jgi:hypothetical protein
MRWRTEIKKQSNVATSACLLICALPTVLLPIHGTSTDQVLKTDNNNFTAWSLQPKMFSFKTWEHQKIDSVFPVSKTMLHYSLTSLNNLT